jgi:hypothetical protein
MTVEHIDGMSVGNLPKAQGTIITAARQDVTLGAKRKAPNPIGVSMQYPNIKLGIRLAIRLLAIKL